MVVFDGRLHVHYGQAYVFSGDADETGEMDACFRGQLNGLVGAALPGELFLMTGLHTGYVQFRVVGAAEPLPDETWEECVEASFEPSGEVRLVDWDRNLVCNVALDQRQAYRARYHARGMDAGHEADTILEDEAPVDEYRLFFWPAAAAPDRIVRRTSAQADYWHRWAQAL